MGKESYSVLRAIIFIGSFFSTSPSHAMPPDLKCTAIYEETGRCPKATCVLECAGGLYYDGCLESCRPKPCFEIEAVHCPEDRCQVLDGCGDEKRCYYPTDRQESECGDIAYPGQEVECCPGLIRRCGVEFFDGTCDMVGVHSVYSVPVCLPCGNGVCNQFENVCNCPEDCQ